MAAAVGGAGWSGRMTDATQPATVGEVFHRFPGALAGLLGMEVDGLRALYDMPAPDPRSPDFGVQVQAVAADVGCAPDILAHLLRCWTPAVS